MKKDDGMNEGIDGLILEVWEDLFIGCKNDSPLQLERIRQTYMEWEAYIVLFCTVRYIPSQLIISRTVFILLRLLYLARERGKYSIRDLDFASTTRFVPTVLSH